MNRFDIRPMGSPPWPGLDALEDASVREGLRFLPRLREEYERGENQFDQEGEVLLGVFRGAQLVAVGGLNRDPYSGRPAAGRVRHLYVLPSVRREGVGRALVQALIAHARPRFDELVLRTDTAAAARFYEALGFVPDSSIAGATHRLPAAAPGQR